MMVSRTPQGAPIVFISYAWESSTRRWVRDLAAKLRGDGIDCKLDQWELVPGDQIPEFMNRAVRDSDYVLIICTPRYKRRSDARRGGVGYEGDIMSAEVFQKRNHRKFIPIVSGGSWIDCSPSWLSGKLYVDLSSGLDSPAYQNLVLLLHGQHNAAPPLGERPSFLKPNEAQAKIARRATRIRESLLGARVLVINDHPRHMRSTITLLTNSGVQVEIAEDTETAIQLLTTSSFDVVISDMKRGDIRDEGMRFLRRARKLDIALPTIFSVALFEPERGVPPHAFGISNYVDEIVHLTFDALERVRG